MTRLPYSYQAQIIGRRSFEKMYTADQMREYAKKVVADEREACAKVAEEHMRECEGASFGIGAAIRARGNT